MSKKVLFFLAGMFLVLITTAQEITLRSDIDTKAYPRVSFQFNLFEPEVKTQKDFELMENDSLIDFTLNHITKTKENKTKTVLILFENMSEKYHKGQVETMKYILNKAIPSFIEKGDKSNIAVFDRSRKGGSPLNFILSNYTDDTKTLLKEIDDIKPKNDVWSNQESSDLYYAIYEGIEELKKEFSKTNKILLVLSAGKTLNNSNYNSIQTLIQRAKNERVSVYSIQYMLWEHRTIDLLTKETYGEYFHVQAGYKIPGKHTKDDAVVALNNYMNQAGKRLHGQDYEIIYKTSFPNDGKLHHSILRAENGKPFSISFTTPGCNLFCQFQKNRFLYSGIVVVFIALLVVIIDFSAKRRKKIKMKILEQEQKMQEQEEKVKQTNEKLNRQQQEIINKEKEIAKKKKKEELAAKVKEEEDKAILEMKKRGFPVIKDLNTLIEYLINKPFLVFGRDINKSHYVIKDSYVSASHFTIVFKEGEYFIEDLRSSNGTKLNAKKIEKIKINNNDIIEVGNKKLMFLN